MEAPRTAPALVVSAVLWVYGCCALATCIAIPEDAEQPLVVACETESEYRINVVGTEHAFDKTAFRAALRSKLRAWIDSTAPDPDVYRDAEIDFWLAVPDANPEATQARAVVRAGPASFVVYLALEPSAWRVGEANVGLLAGRSYPGSYGFRAGSLLVKAAPGAAATPLAAWLASFGVTLEAEIGSQWWQTSVAPFSERSAQNAVLRSLDRSQYVASLGFDHVVEWIARRERAYTFSLSGR